MMDGRRLFDEPRTAGESRVQLVVFRAGTTLFGFDVGLVDAVLGPTRVVELPTDADFLLGGIVHRGSVVPVIDSRTRFGAAAADGTARFTIVLHLPSVGAVALAVDEVLGVVSVDRQRLRGPSPLLTRLNVRFVKHTGTLPDGRPFSWIDADALLGSTEADVLRRINEDGAGAGED